MQTDFGGQKIFPKSVKKRTAFEENRDSEKSFLLFRR